MCGRILLIEDLISFSLIYFKYFLYLFKIKKNRTCGDRGTAQNVLYDHVIC